MRHPRVALVLTSVAIAGFLVFCAVQISDGTYLGASWLIAAVAGMVAGAALSAAVFLTNLHRSSVNGLGVAWTVLLALSVLSIEFTLGRHGSARTFVNVVHAISLGYVAATCAALIALFAFLLIHPGALPSRAALRQQFPRRQFPRRHRPALGWPAWLLVGAAVGVIAGVSLAVAAGPGGHDGESRAAGFLILVALAALCVAVPAALYKRIRSRRLRRRDLSR